MWNYRTFFLSDTAAKLQENTDNFNLYEADEFVIIADKGLSESSQEITIDG